MMKFDKHNFRLKKSISVMIEEPIKVAVIGAGAAGLVAARILSRYGISCKVFEKEDRSGGIWHFRPKDPTHPMYRNLRTNLPREIMAYRELPWTTPSGEKRCV
jgi:cation diffusion facilitator CzcD-associated flavoprotein CzcO